MLILFPNDQNSPSHVDPEFEGEWYAARSNGFPTGFYDDYMLRSGHAGTSVLSLPAIKESMPLLFRGWMVPGDNYQALFDALRSRGYELQTTPGAYEEAHYLPLAYPHIQGHCPRSAWIVGDEVDAAWNLYAEFSNSDAIIKDWVKSAKSRWKDGCFIPANTKEETFRQIYKVFRETRGKWFNRGVVLREFMPLVAHGSDIRGLPTVEETRLFFWKGDLIVLPDERSPSPMDERARWEQLARKFKSPFMTVDVAHLIDGSWKVVEVGDGGVSGLPMGLDPMRFYAGLRHRIEVEEAKAPGTPTLQK
jgi:hypothetical protein